MKEERASSEPKKPARRSRFQFTILDLIGLNVLIAVNMLVWHVLIGTSSDADMPERGIALALIGMALPLGAAYLTYRLATEQKIESPLSRLLLLVLIEFCLIAAFSLIPILIFALGYGLKYNGPNRG